MASCTNSAHYTSNSHHDVIMKPPVLSRPVVNRLFADCDRSLVNLLDKSQLLGYILPTYTCYKMQESHLVCFLLGPHVSTRLIGNAKSARQVTVLSFPHTYVHRSSLNRHHIQLALRTVGGSWAPTKRPAVICWTHYTRAPPP